MRDKTTLTQQMLIESIERDLSTTPSRLEIRRNGLLAASTTELYEKISSNEDLVVAANARAKAAEAQLEELLKEAMTRFDYILLDGDRNRQVDIERIEFENTIAGIQNILDKYTARRRTN